MKKIFLGVVIVLVVLLGWIFFGDSNSGDVPVSDNSNAGSPDALFVLTGENFKFTKNGVDNPELKVKEGETVRIEFSSVGGTHDFVIDEFGASTEIVSSGGSTFVEFVADKTGSYEYYCSIGSHRAQGMFGNFIVE